MLSELERQTLKILAKQSIEYGLTHGCPLPIDLDTLSEILTVPRATFVTIEKNGQLRGCIGMLEAQRPLAQDIAANSYAAAFADPRFPPVSVDELIELDIHLSILSPPEAMHCRSEAELLQLLRPDIDGLILDDGGLHRATFLPSVWESLPNPIDFIHHLKYKAGLPMDYWSDNLQAYRYTTESF